MELRILEELLEDKSATFLIMIGHLINDLFVWMRSFVALNVGEAFIIDFFPISFLLRLIVGCGNLMSFC